MLPREKAVSGERRAPGGRLRAEVEEEAGGQSVAGEAEEEGEEGVLSTRRRRSLNEGRLQLRLGSGGRSQV